MGTSVWDAPRTSADADVGETRVERVLDARLRRVDIAPRRGVRGVGRRRGDGVRIRGAFVVGGAAAAAAAARGGGPARRVRLSLGSFIQSESGGVERRQMELKGIEGGD